MSNLQVTSLENLAQVAKGRVVELPGWNEDKLVARVKRPSLQGLLNSGQIPNALLSIASQIFFQNIPKDKPIDMKGIAQVQHIIAKEALMEPTYEQIKEAGLHLTDEQLVALFNYSQMGIKALEPFRGEQSDNANNKSSQDVSS